MEDPWGSPWATDTPAPPTIDLPSEPQQAHYGNSPRKPSPSPSPWSRSIETGVDDWEGWNEPTPGKPSPGWGRSPSLKPLGNAMGLALDPWALATDDKEEGKGFDSAIGLGDDGQAYGHDDSTTQIEENEVWEKGHVEPNQEDAAVRRHSMNIEPTRLLGERQTSKVQELVEMYDGMAKSSSVGPSRTETATTKDEQTAEAKFPDDVDDVGDELVSDIPTPSATSPRPMNKDEIVLVANHCEAGLARDADPDTKTGESNLDMQITSEQGGDKVPSSEMVLAAEKYAKPDQVTQNDGSARPTDAATENKTLSHSPKASIPYPIDFSTLNILFPNTQAVTTIPEEIPEAIIKESFTSVSQRKAWYRISRFGSIRKYNDGDDDNYVRVAWKNSIIRKDTLATVRRWMEEDSIGGGVVSGRRFGHGGSMFNWDSEAPPIEIGELLAKKKQKPKGHARQTSTTLAGTVTSPIIASFGWNSSVPSSPATEGISSEWHPKSSRLSETIERDETEEKRASADKPQPLPSPKLPTARVLPSVLEPVPTSQDEDDDWGDMVSSQTLESSTAFNTVSLIESGYRPTPTPAAEASILKENGPAHALDAPTEELDPWGGLEFFGGDSTGQNLRPMSSIKGDTAALLIAPMEVSTSAPLAQPAGDEAIGPSWQSSSFTPSRPGSAELAPSNSQDDEAVATILAALPDLSYMMR